MRRGWVCLEFDEDDLPEIGDISKEYKKADENSRWFFFQNNGKAKRSLTGNYDQETIHGEKFYFDRNGAMLTGWHAVKEKADSDDATGISRFVYLGGKDDGAIAKGQWKQLSEHPGDSDDGAAILKKGDEELPREGDKEWYYFENNGTPAYLKTGISTMNAATIRVDGENYFVNQYGCRRNGLVKIVSGVAWVKTRAQQLLKALHYTHTAMGNSWGVSTSIGIALTSREAQNFETLYRKADDALYMSKKNGRNNYTLKP